MLEASLHGPQYEAYMLALEESLLDDLQQEQDALEAEAEAEGEAQDQLAADQLAELLDACSMSSASPRAAGSPSSSPHAGNAAQPSCPVCESGVLERTCSEQHVTCSLPGCVQSAALLPQGVHEKASQLRREHAASGCLGVPAFKLTNKRDDAVFACSECGLVACLQEPS